MGIVDLQVHRVCHHYMQKDAAGFDLFKPQAGDVWSESANMHYILYLMEGSIELLYHGKKLLIQPKELFFFPKGSELKMAYTSDSKVLLAFFASFDAQCEKLDLFSLQKDMPDNFHYEPRAHTIKSRLWSALELLELYLSDGGYCVRLHDLKMYELFWVFRAYYERQELIDIFAPIIGSSMEFRSMVLEHYDKTYSVSKLAKSCYMSRSSFYGKFLDEFGVSASEWITDMRCKGIKQSLADPSLTISDITTKFAFSSESNFSRFCKKNMGLTPVEIRTHLIAEGSMVLNKPDQESKRFLSLSYKKV